MTSLTVNDVTDLVKSENRGNRIRDVTNLCEKFSITKAVILVF